MLGFFLILIIVFLIGIILIGSSIMGLIACKLYKTKRGKKANIILRILLIIVLLAGSLAVILPTVFVLACLHDAPKSITTSLFI